MSKTLLATFSVVLIPLAVGVVGCSNEAAAPKANPDAAAKGEAVDAEKEAAIAANMAKLSDEDRKAAEAQKFCAVENGNRLGGSMGVPYKVMIEGQPVFLCCDGCEEEALKDKQATLAKVAKLKQENAK
jgi:hypothetical protein